jgi:hypothetical protein
VPVNVQPLHWVVKPLNTTLLKANVDFIQWHLEVMEPRVLTLFSLLMVIHSNQERHHFIIVFYRCNWKNHHYNTEESSEGVLFSYRG